MVTLHDIPTPALVVDLDVLERNLGRMAERARSLEVELRPHVKTHKCVEIGRMQVAAGARGITVATLHEAEVFATAGFDDILWAFPVIPSRVDQAVELAQRIRLGLVVDGPEAIDLLGATGEALEVWVKVDCGYHRCGVEPEVEAIARLLERAGNAGLSPAGLLSHSGDAYAAADTVARAAAGQREASTLAGLARRLRAAGHTVEGVSVGSTPSMTAVATLEGVTEARPGNYAYFDRTQVALGSCAASDCALSVVSTVISSARDRAVIDAGALALSKDRGPDDGRMASVLESLEGGRPRDDLWVTDLSQEHGKLSAPMPWGTRLRLSPNHSCLTAACFTHLHAARGTEVVDRWRVWNGR